MEQTTTERVASEVRAALGRQRLTNRWLARSIGMAPTTLHARITGQRAFDINQLDAVARALGLELEIRFIQPTDERRVA